MQAVILAAGLGKRLRPVTERRSKAMVPVVGRPLVERALEPLVEAGFRDVVMVVGPEDEGIRRHFGPCSNLGVSVQWATQSERLGMAHALGSAAHLIRGKFLLSACDSLVSTAHIRDLVAAARGADTVLSLLEVEPEAVGRSAAVEIDGERVRRIVEKPRPGEAPSSTISLPHYVLPAGLLALLANVQRSARGEYELQEAIQARIDEGARVLGVRADFRFQVSTPDDLLSLSRRLLRADAGRLPQAAPDAGAGTRTIGPVLIEPGAAIGAGCTIGPEVYLESGCVIGDRAVVRDSLVLRGGRVAEAETVVGAVVAG
jgi:bifunctional UDP-N-acetylglucosamine pyrophosphorylase/glucosamine-1-phosphate N-acetyltransferase